MSRPSVEPVQALLLVDLQSGLVTGDGGVPGGVDLVAAIGPLLARARNAGVVIVHLQNDGPVGADDEPGTPGWVLHFDVVASAGEFVVRKSADNAFAGTRLGQRLRESGVARVCVVGALSEMCVMATARGAIESGLGVVLPHDGHATFDVPAAPGSTTSVPAAMASRVAEWALGDQVEVVATTRDVPFAAPPTGSAP